MVGDQTTNHTEELLVGTRALLDDLLDATTENPAILLRQVLRRQHDDRNVLPFGIRSHLEEEIESIHHRHHQIEQDQPRLLLRQSVERIVLAHEDPGLSNWIDTGERPEGMTAADDASAFATLPCSWADATKRSTATGPRSRRQMEVPA